jgi:PAS domain S-box-containing protein
VTFEAHLVTGITSGPPFPSLIKHRPSDSAREITRRLTLDDEKTPLRLSSFLSDITKRQESEREREQLALLVGSSREFIVMCRADFRMFFINQAGLEMVGLSDGDAGLHIGMQQCFFPEDVEYVFGEFFPRAVRDGHAETEVRLRHFITSKPIWTVFRGSVLRDGAGEVIALTGMGLNVTERKEAEERLRVSEERFRSYFELGLIGMAMTSPSKGILEVNDKICEILGYGRSELLRMSWVEITHPDDRPADFAQFNRLLSREIDACELEKRWVRKDGRIIDSVISVKCLRHPDGSINYIVALLEDVTERRRAEANRDLLAEINADFSHLIGKQEIMDVAGEKLLRHLKLSRCAFATIDGGSFIEICECSGGTLPSFAAHYPMAAWFDRRLSDRLSAGEIVCVDDVRIDPSTAACALNYQTMRIRSFIAVPLHREGHWEFCLGVSREKPSAWQPDEIELVREFAVHAHLRLERAAAHERLRQSEEHLRALVSQSVGGIAEADLTGRITLVNDRYCQIIGFTREELLDGMTMESLTVPAEIDNARELLRVLLATGEPFQTERRYLRKDGSYVWVNNSVSCIRSADGKVESLIYVTVDIDERKHAESRLKRAHAELEGWVQDRTAALSAANEALQRQILEKQGIEREREDLMRRLAVAQEEERRRIARELHDDFAQRLAALQIQVEMGPTSLSETTKSSLSRQLDALSNDLRNLSHQLHPSILDDLGLEVALRTLVESMVAAAQWLDVHLEIHNLPSNISVTISATLYRIAQEALRNVVKHTGPGVSVNIELFSYKGAAHLSVSDTGPGFDPQLVRDRHGIGLDSMHERARLAGGNLVFESHPGRGTRVTAILPFTGDSPIEVPRLLICDDDPEIRSLLVDLVTPGCEVVGEAWDGQEAVDLALQLVPDLMLLDISMPGMGGLEVARLLRERLPRIRIIFVTEKRERSYVDQAFALGAQGYVLKSMAASELPIALREVSAGREFRSPGGKRL